jgi:hypothetical protein
MACDTMLQIDGANEVQGVPFHCGYMVIGVRCWRPWRVRRGSITCP